MIKHAVLIHAKQRNILRACLISLPTLIVGHQDLRPFICITSLLADHVVIPSLSSFISLAQVHSLYRQTGASFQKAQAEFATGVLSNEAVRQAAVNATATAAQGAFTGAR